VGDIARGAATTILLIVVTTLVGTLLSILGAAGRRNGSEGQGRLALPAGQGEAQPVPRRPVDGADLPVR